MSQYRFFKTFRGQYKGQTDKKDFTSDPCVLNKVAHDTPTQDNITTSPSDTVGQDRQDTLRRKVLKSKHPKISEDVRLLVQTLKKTTLAGGNKGNTAMEAGEAYQQKAQASPRDSSIHFSSPPRSGEKDYLFTWHNDKRKKTGYNASTLDDLNDRLLDYVHSNPNVRQILIEVMLKADQYQATADVLDKLSEGAYIAVSDLFDEESCQLVEKFMDLFEKFARSVGVDEKALISHFENRNYLFQLGITCLKDVGIREPLKSFAQFLKVRCAQDGPAFYVYKIIGKTLERGDLPNLERPQPYTWEEFYGLYAEYMESAGIPDELLVKTCAKRVFEEGLLTLKERDISDPIKKFAEFVHSKQCELQGLWRKAADIFAPLVNDVQTPITKRPAIKNHKIPDSSPPSYINSIIKKPCLEQEAPPTVSTRSVNVVSDNKGSTATLSLASMTSPRQMQTRASTETVDTKCDRELDNCEKSECDDLDIMNAEMLLNDMGLMQESDECDYFGKMVTCCVRNLPNEKARELAKIKIQRVLYKVRFGTTGDSD